MNNMNVYWNRKDTYNEVSCKSAHHAATILCDGHELIRLVKRERGTNYVFRYGQFERFPRLDSDFAELKRKIPVKKYFDTYRSFLNGDCEQFFELVDEQKVEA